MQFKLDNDSLIVHPENDAERARVSAWHRRHADRPLETTLHGDGSLSLAASADQRFDLPLNITFGAPVPFRIIANLAPAPFDLDGRHYGSVEGFWQGLKFPDGETRARIAPLAGFEAKCAGNAAAAAEVIHYQNQRVRVGTVDHWALMERACRAKFSQCAEARAALLATGSRPLEHKVKVDSRNIPGIVMADIWMRIRREPSAAGSDRRV